MSVLFTRRGPAPSMGTLASDLEIGSSVFLNVSGALKEFLIVHQGNPSSTFYGSNGDGTWLLMKDIYETRARGTSSQHYYADTSLHSYLNKTFISHLDSNIQNAIKEVSIPYPYNSNPNDPYQQTATDVTFVNTKIFVLSLWEVGLEDHPKTVFEDGRKLDYFDKDDGWLTADPKRTASLNGTNMAWWLRPNYNQGHGAFIAENGTYDGEVSNTYEFGVRPALILPSDIKIDPDTNQIAA